MVIKSSLRRSSLASHRVTICPEQCSARWIGEFFSSWPRYGLAQPRQSRAGHRVRNTFGLRDLIHLVQFRRVSSRVGYVGHRGASSSKPSSTLHSTSEIVPAAHRFMVTAAARARRSPTAAARTSTGSNAAMMSSRDGDALVSSHSRAFASAIRFRTSGWRANPCTASSRTAMYSKPRVLAMMSSTDSRPELARESTHRTHQRGDLAAPLDRLARASAMTPSVAVADRRTTPPRAAVLSAPSPASHRRGLAWCPAPSPCAAPRSRVHGVDCRLRGHPPSPPAVTGPITACPPSFTVTCSTRTVCCPDFPRWRFNASIRAAVVRLSLFAWERHSCTTGNG